MLSVLQHASASEDVADALRRMEDALQLSRCVVWEVDRDGVFTYVSSSLEDLLGYRPEELVGRRTIHEFYPPDMPEDLRRELSSDWIGKGEAFSGEKVPLLAKSGEVVWVSSSGRPLHDAEGRIMGFRGAETDITALKLAEDRIQASEQLLLRQIAEAPVPIAHTDWPASERIHVNKAFVRTFGYEPEEIPTAEAWFSKAYPDEAYRRKVADDNEALMTAVARGEKSAPTEYKVTCKDGRVLDVEIAAALVGGAFLGTFVDVTGRNLTRARIEESERKFRLMIENAPVPASYTRDGGRLLSFNKAFTRAFGWTIEDVPTYEAWFEKVYPDPDYRQEVLRIWSEDLEKAQKTDGRIGSRIYRIADKRGAQREAEISAVLLGGEMFGTFMDLTERNRAERLLREQRDQLARVGRVSALGQLAASLAHELDQPLGAILNNAETARLLLGEKNPDLAEVASILRDIIEDDHRAGAVLDRIRAMVQKQPFRPAQLEVPMLFSQVSELVLPVVEARGIKLEISAEPGLSAVEGDAVLLQQALLNLILNATDAIGSREGGRIELRAGEAERKSVGISVRDNGGGVAEQEKDRLLEPFHTTKDGGMGMGLPIVATIAEQHGGELRIENMPGRGLAVTLVLPAWRGQVRQ